MMVDYGSGVEGSKCFLQARSDMGFGTLESARKKDRMKGHLGIRLSRVLRFFFCLYCPF
jgi:hypothetical protein